MEADIPLQRLERSALSRDLVVLGQHEPGEVGSLTHPEAVILACGRPALVVPYVGAFDHVGRKVLIAWNGRREAARAAHDALPLMAASESVTVLSVDADQETTQIGDELVGNLGRHGVKASRDSALSLESSIAEVILSRAADLSSDLIVLGCYGHSRMRELVLGGVTREILRSMTVPVLMAH